MYKVKLKSKNQKNKNSNKNNIKNEGRKFSTNYMKGKKPLNKR